MQENFFTNFRARKIGLSFRGKGGQMRKALIRKGFALLVIMVFILVIAPAGQPAQAADKDQMPMGPAKIFVAPCHGFARLLNTAWTSFWWGAKKYGPLGPVAAACVFAIDTAENVPRTVANTFTPFNGTNYNYDVGKLSPTAQAVKDGSPAILPF